MCQAARRVRGQRGLVHRGYAVQWQWMINAEADGVLHCTVQGTGTGTSPRGEEHRGVMSDVTWGGRGSQVSGRMVLQRVVRVWLDQRVREQETSGD